MHDHDNADAPNGEGISDGADAGVAPRADSASVMRSHEYGDNRSATAVMESVPALEGSRPASTEPRRVRFGASAAAIVVVLALAAVACWFVLRPLHAPTATASDAEITAAKERACTAYNTVHTAVSLQTHANAGNDAAAVQATAANARLALAAGGAYLLGRLDPATPAPLAAAVRSFAENLQDIAINTLAGATNQDPAQSARLREGEENSVHINDMCR